MGTKYTMLDFSPVSPDHIICLKKAFASQPFRACDYTVGAVWQWRKWFDSKVAFVGPCAVLTADYPGKGAYYQFPCGGDADDMKRALLSVERDAEERGTELRFCAVPAEGLKLLGEVYGERMKCSEDRDWADYLYDIGDLKLFPGKRFHGQKNHLNRFLKEHPFSYFVPLTEETLPQARAFLAEYDAMSPQEKPIEREEMLRSRELVEMAGALGLKAGFLRADADHICALSVGEVVGDTLYVHVEKADTAYAGAYQAIVSAFAQYAADTEVKWCNREDDSGEEGLRQSKQSYHPVRLIEKYWVTVDR